MEIAETLQNEGVDVAIPPFEETVEWAGAINSVLLDNPRLYGQAMLLRDKALMKRRAQLGGIRAGIFEEAHDRDDVIRFLKRVNQTPLKLDGDPNDPIHLKALDKAGCLGHRVIRTPDEVDMIPLLAVWVTAACVSGNAGGIHLLSQIATTSPRVTKARADTGYRTKAIDHGAHLGIDVEVVRKDPGVKGFKVIPRRWVVERTFGGSCTTDDHSHRHYAREFLFGLLPTHVSHDGLPAQATSPSPRAVH